MNFKETLDNYIDAGFPILYVSSYEESKVDEVIKNIARGKSILEWNGVTGFSDWTTSINMPEKTLSETLKMLSLDTELNETILILKDCQSLIEDPEIIALLKYIAHKIQTGDILCSIIIESIIRRIPKELEPYITILEMDYLSTAEIRQNITDFLEVQGTDATIADELLEEMSIAFKGLSELEITNILSLAFGRHGELTRDDLKLINEQKRQMIMKSGILEMVLSIESMDNIGGLDNLKTWIQKKAKIIKNVEKAKSFGVDVPKGVLIAGIPGCGKSLNAKAAANLFEVPLLRLDMGRLMGKYVGESEANMRNAIRLAEAIAPCVLWVDELEKAFAGIGGNGGEADITTRLFGNFLTWMQEKESTVFVVATANELTKLPPELLRKGRFDEIFYVSLPNAEERKKIFKIHIGKRRNDDLKNIDFDKLVSKTEGYSGADIEGVVKESIENVYSEDQKSLHTDDIIRVIQDTHSLSEIMAEPLKKLKEEYEKRNFKNASR